MKLPEPLFEGVLLRRYKRFLADVELADGTVLTVHCPNPGRMTSCSEPGRPVLISDSGNPKRKLRYTLELIRMGRTWVGVNAMRPNGFVERFVRRGRIPELAGYDEVATEVRYGVEGRSRVDLLLRKADRRDAYVEIKNTTYRTRTALGDAGLPVSTAAFPDAVTERGKKHLLDLFGAVEGGHRAVLFFFVGRADCQRFRPADEVDPDYGATLRQVAAGGVEILAYRMRFTRRQVTLDGRLSVDL